MENTETSKFLLLIVGVFVVALVGFILGTPIFGQLNTAYTSTYVNSTTATFHNNQPFIMLIGLGYVLAIVFIPLALLGILAMKVNKKGLFDMNAIISKIVMILIMIFVGVILYLALLPIANGFYTTANGYSWTSSFLTLITLAPLFYVLGIALMAIFEGVSIIREVM